MAFHSTWDSVVVPMVGWRGHNEMFESQVGPFNQRSPNLLMGLPRLPMSAGFCVVGRYVRMNYLTYEYILINV